MKNLGRVTGWSAFKRHNMAFSDFIYESEQLNQLLNLGVGSVPLIVDCRGPDEYAAGHIPGAISFPAALVQDPDSTRGELFPVERLHDMALDAGLLGQGEMLLYDDSGLVQSTRVFWVLELLGRDSIRILNGGGVHWKHSGYPWTTEVAEPSPTVDHQVPIDIQSHRIISLEELVPLVEHGSIQLVDARSAKEYAGAVPTAKRDGHIPSAVNVDWQEHIHGLFDPRFKDEESLRALYRTVGIDLDHPIVCYCRSGNRSTHTYFVLRALGAASVCNYLGSWLEWGNEAHTPVIS